MKKWILPALMLALCSRVFAVGEETLPLSAMYEMTEMGYLDAPMQTAGGLIVTDNRQSTVYAIKDGRLLPLLTTPGAGRYAELNADKTLLGFKQINQYGQQAPAVLNLKTRRVTLLEEYTDQCGQVSFAADGTMAYTMGKQLIIVGHNGRREMKLGYYTNIVRLSPDGRMIALSNNDGQPMLLSLENMQMQRLSDLVELYNPRWSADSRKLVYEQSNMTLYTFDLTTGTSYCLGRGFGAHWLNKSELVFSRPEYQNGDNFFCEGISVCRSSFNGKQISTIIPASQECPQEVGLMADGTLLVPYSNGERRIEQMDINGGSKTTLLQLPADRQLTFSAVSDECRPVAALTGNTIGGPVDWEEIPYINQKNDVAPYGTGGKNYGPCACAPSTSCMLLGFYGLLEPHPYVSASSWSATTDYAWYVGQIYTHPATGYTFDAEAWSSCGGGAAGGYGFMWFYGSPATMMGQFYLNNNTPAATYDYNGLTAIRSETENGFPFSWCITSTKTSGHLILPYRHDCAYKKVNGEYTYVESNGSVVVQDPYGNANNSTWGGSDGRHITYDCSGYNNGYLQMVNAWGVKVHISRTPCTIAYSLNGGHFEQDSVPTVFYSDLRLPVPVKDGATFQGWFADRTYSGTRYSTLSPNCGIDTLFALWSDMPLVRYYLNGGAMPEGVVLPAVIEETYTLPSPIRNGFTFAGWFWLNHMLGDPVTELNPGDAGQLYATWTRSVGLDDTEIGLRYINYVVLNPNGLMLSVFNADGRLVMQGAGDMHLEHLPQGMYLIRSADCYLKVMR